jgi:cobalt-precorrin-5B (C1)-methyltransferase
MWPESTEHDRPLRSGLTTGCCATACSIAAAQLLLTNTVCDRVSVTLPRGKTVELDIEHSFFNNRVAKTVIRKDAGDDPDVTHGANVFVEMQLLTDPGVNIVAAQGVGIVTKKGLALDVGEAAINPVPRKMITQHLHDISQQLNYSGGYRVAVGVENGAALAQKTMNPRLGIVGGLSILGTTGVVRPYSCSAYIASIRQGLDVCHANDIDHIAATTGSSSEQYIRNYYCLPDTALIEMGDFVGVVLKHLKKVAVKKISLCGGFGKISKLADGQMDLHSRSCAINFNALAALALQAGASTMDGDRIRCANTSIEALAICAESNIALGNTVCEKARDMARSMAPENIQVEVWAIDRQGNKVGFAGAEGSA